MVRDGTIVFRLAGVALFALASLASSLARRPDASWGQGGPGVGALLGVSAFVLACVAIVLVATKRSKLRRVRAWSRQAGRRPALPSQGRAARSPLH